ncbi:hypothetical protein D3C85_1270100 [compost metagenome]
MLPNNSIRYQKGIRSSKDVEGLRGTCGATKGDTTNSVDDVLPVRKENLPSFGLIKLAPILFLAALLICRTATFEYTCTHPINCQAQGSSGGARALYIDDEGQVDQVSVVKAPDVLWQASQRTK